jgi:tRNA-guanine family transglycosylase
MTYKVFDKIPVGSIFVPAIGPQYYTFWRRNDEYNGNDFKWYTDKSYFQYNYGLISAFFGTRCNDYRNVVGWPSDRILIGDSGGFQIASFRRRGTKINIEPVDILRWQEKNCDIGMNLDVPSAFGRFEDCLKGSVENFEMFEKFSTGVIPLYNVLHGETISNIKSWYEDVKKFNFDGWAIGSKSGLFTQLYGYLYLREMGATNLQNGIHLFGMTSLSTVIALAMIARRYKQRITYDSSSYSMGARDRRFYHSHSIRYFSEFRRENLKSLQEIPCDCPVCRKVDIGLFYSQTDVRGVIALSLHDLYQYVNVCDNINAMSADSEVLLDYVKSQGEEKIYYGVQRMLNCFDSGGCKKVEEDCLDLLQMIYNDNGEVVIPRDRGERSVLIHKSGSKTKKEYKHIMNSDLTALPVIKKGSENNNENISGNVI